MYHDVIEVTRKAIRVFPLLQQNNIIDPIASPPHYFLTLNAFTLLRGRTICASAKLLNTTL